MGCGQITPVVPLKHQTAEENERIEPLIARTSEDKMQASKPTEHPKQSSSGVPNIRPTIMDVSNPSPNDTQLLAKLDEASKKKLQMAEDLMKRKEYKNARSEYLKIVPQDEYILNQIAETYYQESTYKQALEWLEKSLKLNNNYATTYFKLGRVHYYREDYNISIQNLQKCLSLSGDNAILLSALGQSYYYKQDYQNALKYQTRSYKINPKDSKILEQLALTHYYLEDYEKAIEFYKKILEVDPKNARIMSDIGLSYYQNEDYESAEPWFLKAIQLESKVAKHYIRIGQNFYYKQEYAISKEWHTKAIALDPKNDQPYSEMGINEYYEEDYEEAIKWYKKALAINDKNYLTHHRMALAYYYLEDYPSSINWEKTCLKLKPGFWSAVLGMGNSYYYQENYVEAIKYFKMAIDINPKLHYSYFMCGKSLYYEEKSEEAIPFYNEAVKISPQDIFNLVYLGKALIEIQNFGESFKVFTKAKELFEKNKKGSGNSFLQAEIDQFIKNSAEWEVKKKMGYISEKDKQEIKQMKQNFEKKFKSIFGVSSNDTKGRPKKPLNPAMVSIAKLIHQDKFQLSTEQKQSSPIIQIATQVREIFNYDKDSFQIFAYLFEQYVWMEEYESETPYAEIQNNLATVVRALSLKYPPTAKTNASPQNAVTFPEMPVKKINLFVQTQYYSSYEQLVKEIEKVNEIAKADLAPFRQLVFSIQKSFKGSHAKVGMKLPEKAGLQSEDYQQKMFKVLIRIFQKMFKELSGHKEQMFQEIQQRLSKKQIPIYSVILIIMNIWIDHINQILVDREQKRQPTECCISDLVRGKCMFESVEAIQNASLGLISLCKTKGYEITELDNRLFKQTQDVVFKIRIKNVVSQLQLALEFDTVAFDFGHNFYEIQRCPLGCIFGSCLFLTKDVEQSFLQTIFETKNLMKASHSKDKEGLQALAYVIDEFKKSTSK